MTPSVDTERKLRELSFLHEVAQLASSARDWDEMLRIVIDRTTDAMGVEVSSLYLLERREGILRLVATNGLNRPFLRKATRRVGAGAPAGSPTRASPPRRATCAPTRASSGSRASTRSASRR